MITSKRLGLGGLKGSSQREGLLWAQTFTNVSGDILNKGRSQTMNSPAARTTLARRGSLLTKEMQIKLKISNFKEIDIEAVNQILNLSEKTKGLLSAIKTYSYNIFAVKEATNDNELVTTVSYILAHENIFDTLPIINEKFLSFIRKVQSSYKSITYHNKTHAADLAQNFYYFIENGGLREKCDLDNWDICSYILAASCHDLGHPGFANPYLIEKGDLIAIRYNDMSVLENYHIAMTFEILSKSDYNIFADLEKSDYKRVRKTMIGAVLATDMSMHFNKIGILKGKLSASELDATQEAEKKFICEQIFHLCDIANSTKDFSLCEKWT